MSDPTLVHGLVRLLKDDTSPAGLAFAPHGKAEGAISDPRDLPDAEVSLRLFVDPVERAGYQAALTEVGGNAVSTVFLPGTSSTPTGLLVIRHDRGPRDGTTLDEVIELRGAGPNTRSAFERMRAAAEEDLARNVAFGEALRAWSSEASFVRSIPRAIVSEIAESGITFHCDQNQFRTTREGGRLVVSWAPLVMRWEDDIEARWRDGIAGLGVALPGGRIGVTGEDAAETVPRALTAARELAVLSDRLMRLHGTRREIANVRREDGKLLGAVAAGHAVTTAFGGKTLRYSPRAKAAVPESGAAASRLVSLGLLEKLGQASDGTPPRPVLYVITEAGLALAAGDRETAARLAAERPRLIGKPRPVDLQEAVDALRSGDADAFDADHFPSVEEDASLERLVRSSEDSPEWPAVLTALASDAYRLSDEGTLVKDPGRPTP